MESGERAPRVHWAVKAFVVFHLFAIATWSLPPPPERVTKPSAEFVLRDTPNYFLKANTAIKESPVRDYLFFTGQWQSWDMFAPNPSNTDIWMDAIVTYQDGSEARFIYPRMVGLPITEKYFKERYRKFFENINNDRFSYKWPAVAERIALLSYKAAENPPVKVVLVRHSKKIAPSGQVQSEDYVSVAFYTHIIDTDRLKRRQVGG